MHKELHTQMIILVDTFWVLIHIMDYKSMLFLLGLSVQVFYTEQI